MEARFVTIPPTCVVSMLALTLCACATRRAPDFGGAWQAVNRYEAVARPLPLVAGHRFRALPTERSLRELLLRWARESQRRLSYRYPDDFTLHEPVAGIDRDRVDAAAAELAAAYSRYGVSILVSPDEIVVRPAIEPGPTPVEGTQVDTASARPLPATGG